MPAIPPSDISGFLSAFSVDPHTIAGSTGAAVSSYGQYAVSPGFAAPTLVAGGLNGYKTIRFAPGQSLSAAVPDDTTPPSGNTSGGAFPGGFTVVAVLKPASLATRVVSGTTCGWRTLVGFRNASGVWSPLNGWTLRVQGVPAGASKQEALLMRSSTAFETWGSFGDDAIYNVAQGSWVVVGMVTNGVDVRLYKGRSLDRVNVNTGGPTQTQWVNRLTLGADLSWPQYFDFDGEFGYVAVFDRPLSASEYRDVADWLIARFALTARGINIDVEVGTAGKHVYLTTRDPANNKPVLMTGSLTPTGISYRVNGGPPVVPSRLIIPVDTSTPPVTGNISNPLVRTAAFGFELASAITAGDTLTVSVDPGVIQTDNGFAEELIDQPAVNRAGQATMIDVSEPASYTLKLGYNVSNGGTFYSPEIAYKNLFKGGGSGEETRAVDANGYFTSPTANLTLPLWQGGDNDTPGSQDVFRAYPALEYGRYVVSWDGADGSNLRIVAGTADTVVTPVTSLDVLTGSGKKRYFDVTEAPGSVRKRATLNFQYVTAVYCTNIKVMLARYEGTSGYFTDQTKERLEGMESARFMDFIKTNMTNIGKAADFSSINRSYYGGDKIRTIPISRIESWNGTKYAPTANHQHWKITFAVPHGLTSGQDFAVESTDGNPVNVTFSDGTTRNVVLYDGATDTYPIGTPAKGVVVSPTEFYFPEWRGTSYTHKTTSLPFTGSNARARLAVEARAPIEMMSALVNEANIKTCHVCIPHSLDAAGVTHMATVLANTLNAGKKVWVETSNEPWNFGFTQYGYFRMESVRRGLLPEGSNSANPGYAACSLENWDTFVAGWVAAGRSASDCQLILNAQHANLAPTVDYANYMAANRPGLRVRLSLAPYYDPSSLQFAPGVDYSTWTLNEIMDCHEAFIKSYNSTRFVALHRAEFENRGMSVDMNCYENQWSYMGLSPRGSGATIWDQWEQYNREAFCTSYHPRLWNIAWHHLKEIQASGISTCEFYYYFSYGWVFEIASQGHAGYDDYTGIRCLAGKGDGSDGKPDNRPLLVDGQGKPKWPNYQPLVSPRAGARRTWQDRVTGVGGGSTASEGSVEKNLWAIFRRLSILR